MSSRDALHYADSEREWLESYLPPTFTPDDDKGPPFVTLTFATSLDSALSLAPGVQTALSGPQSKAMTHYLRSRHDAILIGVGTAIADNPSLNCRLDGVGGYGGEGLEGQPRPVVIDPQGRWQLGPDTKILNLARDGRGRPPWIVTSKKPEPLQIALLEEAGGSFIVPDQEHVAAETPRFSWRTVLSELSGRGIRSVMIEGGGGVINALLAAENNHLVSSVIVTVAPTWLGQGGVVVSPVRPQGSDSAVARLQNVKWHQLGQDVVLCGILP